MLEAILLLFIAILVRLASAKTVKHIGWDHGANLYWIKEVKKQKAGFNGTVKTNIVGAKYFRKPFLWFWIMGLLPFNIWYKYQRAINPIMDALFAFLIFWLFKLVGFNTELSLLASSIYLFTPMWFSQLSIGPRIESFTPRLLSEITGNLFFIILLIPFGLPLWFVIASSVLLGSYNLLASKFGTQALFFLTPIISLILLDWLPLIVLLITVLFTALITGGGFLKTLKHQIHHLNWYYKKNLRGEMKVSDRNKFKRLFKDTENKSTLKKTGIVVRNLIQINSVTAVILKMPVFIIAITLYTYSQVYGPIQVPFYFAAPVIAATFLFLIINIQPLLFLGEAERYLNFTAFFILFLAVYLVTALNLYWLFYCLLGYGIFYWFIESFYLKKLNPPKTGLREKEGDILDYLEEVEEKKIILSIPMPALNPFRIMLKTDHKIIYPDICGKEFSTEFEKKYGDDYPFVNLAKLDTMSTDLGVNMVIINKRSIEKRYPGWKPSDFWEKVDIGSEQLDVYKRK